MRRFAKSVIIVVSVIFLITGITSCNFEKSFTEGQYEQQKQDDVRKELDEIGSKANEEVKNQLAEMENYPQNSDAHIEDISAYTEEITESVIAEPYCEFCNGSKKYCSLCDTTGKCRYCDGSGYKNCSRCDGSGVCDACDGQHIKTIAGRRQTCRYCDDGSCSSCDNGKKECNFCQKSGKCKYCNGTAECKNCDGTGGGGGFVPNPIIPDSECEKCYGEGVLDCPSCVTGKCIECNGKGYRKVRVSSLETEEVDCSYCINGKCTKCNGARKILCTH